MMWLGLGLHRGTVPAGQGIDEGFTLIRGYGVGAADAPHGSALPVLGRELCRAERDRAFGRAEHTHDGETVVHGAHGGLALTLGQRTGASAAGVAHWVGERRLLVGNVLGAVLYLVGTSYGWVNPAEHGEVPVTAEPIIWGMAAFPIVGVFTLINLTWGVLLLRGRRGGRVWLATGVLWLAVVFIDFAHHGYPTWTYWWHR